MEIRKRFGTKLRSLREQHGWSQEEFADRAGMHRTYVSSIERGIRNPTLSVLERLAKALGISMAELLDKI